MARHTICDKCGNDKDNPEVAGVQVIITTAAKKRTPQSDLLAQPVYADLCPYHQKALVKWLSTEEDRSV